MWASIIFSSSLICSTMAMIFLSMKEKNIAKKEMKPSFECGFNSMTPKKMTFSTNFFMLTIMFLIFDAEMMILFPAISMNKQMTSIPIMTTTFISALTLLLLKEWTQGALDWNK